MVEIAKAIQGDPAILILDEPTASLTEHEAKRLFAHRAPKEQGLGIIYITHRIQEIRRIADRVTVLRDGRRVATVAAGDVSEPRLVELMTGRTIEALYPTIRNDQVRSCCRPMALRWPTAGSGMSRSTVRAGEVVGLAGLVGSGKSEIGRAIFGLEPIAQRHRRDRG